MPKRRLIPAILAAGILAALIFFLTRPREPSYQGHSLSHWLTVFADPQGQRDRELARTAISHIGTNGIRYYLAWIQYETPDWKLKLQKGLSTIFHGSVPSMLRDNSGIRANCVPIGFAILGPRSQEAIPELTRLMHDPRGFQTGPAQRAARCLQGLKEQALPAYLTLFTNRDAMARASAPIFIAMLRTDTRSAVPALIRALKDEDIRVRVNASNYLFLIAPEALTNAPPP